MTTTTTSYQDRWERGSVVARGERECESRWAAIRQELQRYGRRFTLLELGADLGYFSLRAVEEFDCVAVAIERGPQLVESFRRNDARRAIALQRDVSLSNLERLGECEHFDVVLALNVLHHFDDPLRAFNAAIRLGSEMIFETPPVEDRRACGQPVIPKLAKLAESGRLLHMTPSHTQPGISRPMVHFARRGQTKRLTRAYFDAPVDVLPPADVLVFASTAVARVEIARKSERRGWIPGINLQTWMCLGGAWPTMQAVIRMVREVSLPEGEPHGDIRPWNFILDGERLHLIDGRDEHANFDDAEGIATTLELIASSSAEGGA